MTTYSANRGRWVSERTYAELHGLARQTLCNWRHQDKKASRGPQPGKPLYKRFGAAVRYWLADDEEVMAYENSPLERG
jgi:hypothetical protein